MLWLMPVILTIMEMEIRRITVQDQPRQNVLETPSQSIKTLVTVVCICHPSYVGNIKEESQSRPA
jgi:hypothetical protein